MFLTTKQLLVLIVLGALSMAIGSSITNVAVNEVVEYRVERMQLEQLQADIPLSASEK